MSTAYLIFVLGVLFLSFLVLGWIKKGSVLGIFQINGKTLNIRSQPPNGSILSYLQRGVSGLLVLLGMIFLGAGEVMGQCTETVTFTSTGDGSWLVPAGVSSFTVEVWGAGGAGGRANGNPAAGGGGSGGGYVRRTFTNVTGNVSFFIGQGGAGGSGGNGQSSWFQNNTTLFAIGGNGGGIISNNNTWGGGASAVTTGNIGGTLASFYGGAGGNASSSVSGGGGASAGTTGNGNAASGINGGTSSNGSTAGATGRNDTFSGNNGNSPGSGGSGGRATNNTDRSGGNGGNGQIRITYTYEYCAEFISANLGSSSWCPGETRNISVNIRNGGTATWTNSSPDINIGVRWNPDGNGNWNDFHVRENANNLAPGETRTYNFTLQASNNPGGGYTTPLAAGNNNIRFDVVNEANFWFRNRPGNAEYVSSNITIAPVADIGDMSQIACSGSGFSVTPANGTNGSIPAGTTYSWTAPTAPNGFVTGGVAGSGSSITGNLVNTSNIARPVVYTVTPITNGCVGNPFLINVLVNPTAAINPITSAVCTDDTFSITPANGTNGLVPAGTTYTWTVPSVTGGVTGGLAGSGTFISGTLRNTGNTPQTATYTVTPINGSCVGPPFTVTVTVNPKPALTAISRAVCSNQTFSVTPANGTNGLVPAGTTYTWSAPSVPAGITGGIAGSGTSITGTLINSTHTTQIATYTVTPTSGSCVGNTFTVSVSVNPIPTIPTQTATSCSGNTFTVSPVNGGSTIVPAGTTYTWTVVDNPNVTGESAQASAQPNISQTLTNTSPLPQVVTYTVTPTSGAAGYCPGAPFTVSVTVNPSPVLDSPTLVSRCSNISTGYTATSATSGTTFSWTRAAVAGISNPAGSGSSATANETLVNTTTNPIDVVYLYTLTANGCTNTQSVMVTVNPTPTLSSTLTPAAICSNGVFSYSPSSSTSGASFTWTRAAVAGISNSATTTPQTSNPNEVLVNTTTSPINVVYAYTITANGCSTTENVTVTVNPTPQLSSTLTPSAVCSNTAFSYTPTSLTPGATFTWTRAAVTGISNSAVTTPQASNPNETLVNTTNNPIDVIYSFTTSANGCSNTQNVRVTVNRTPTLNSSLSPAAICSNSVFSYTPTSLASGASFTWTRAAVSGISNSAVTTPQSTNPSETLINTTANPIDVVYAFTIVANGCSNTQNVTVTVNPAPTLNTNLTPDAICSNSVFSYSQGSDTPGANLTWTRAAIAGISNSAVTTPQASNPNETLVNTTANPINVVYVFTITANGCSNTQNVTVTVNPSPVLSSATSLEVCSDDNLIYTATSTTTGTSFSWTRAIVAGISNAAGSGSNETLNEILINTTAVPIDVVYVFNLTANGCSTTQNVTVTVKPSPTLSSATSLEVCDSEEFSYTATSATSGVSFIWTRALVSGISNPANSGSGATITETLVNTTSAPIDVIYEYTLLVDGCSNTQIVTVRVNPTPTLDSSLTPPAVCGDEVFTYTPSSTTTGATFTWTRAAVSGISNGAVNTPQSNNPNEVLVNTTPNPVNVIYTYAITSNGCTNTQEVRVTVNPAPDIFSITEEVCSENTFSITPIHGTDGVVPSGTTYTWTVADNPNVTGESDQLTPQAIISQSLTNTSTTPQVVIYTVTPISGACTGDPFTVTVTVNGDTQIDTQPSGNLPYEVCFGDTFSPISVVASGAIGLTYQWYSNSIDSNSGGTAVPGATSAAFTPPSSEQGESYYYVVVTGLCTVVTSDVSVRYLVTPPVTTVVTPLDTNPQTICAGDNFMPLTFEASGANLTYQWYRNTTASTTGGTAIADADESTFNPPNSDFGPVYYYAQASSDCGTVTSSVSGAFAITGSTSTLAEQTLCVDTPLNPVITHTTTGTTGIVNNGVEGANGLPPGVSATWNAGVITISGIPTSSAGSPYFYSIPLIGACGTEVAAGTITVNPKAVIDNLSETVCTGSSFNIAPIDGTDGIIPSGTTYSWTIPAMPAGLTGGVAGSGNNITGSLVNSTNIAQTATYTVNPTSGTCLGTPFTVTITVNPSPAIPAQTATICDESAFTVTPVNGGATRVPAGTTYTWTVVDNPNVSGEANQPTAQSEISQTLTNTSNVPQNVIYTVTPVSGSCLGNPFTVTVTVNPNPEIPDFTNSVCSGSAFTISPTNGGGVIVPTGTTYTWTVAENPNVTGESNQASAQANISQTLVNLTNLPETVVYTVTPRSGMAGNCVGDPFTVTVTVNPSPVIEDVTDIICSGDTFTISPSNGGSAVVPTGTVYTWTVVNNPNITGESTQTSPQANISQTLTNTSTSVQTVIYTVTPQSGASGACAGNSFAVTVTVNPTPSLSSTLSPADICSNGTFTYTPTSAVTGATFTWTRAAVSGISNSAITTAQTSNPNEVLVNTTSSPIDVIYTYTITANGCNNIQNVTVRVKPTPTLSSSLTPSEICGNSSFTYIPTSNVSGATFTWTRAAVAGISNPAITAPQSSSPNETLINTTQNPIDVVYAFTISANGCSNTQNVTVRVNPRPILSSTLNPAAICSNTAFTYTPTSTSIGANFTWTRAAVAGISNAAVSSPQGSNPNETLNNTTANPIDVVYVFSISAGGCSNTQNVTVTVKPNPILSSTLTPPAICSGSTFAYTPTTATSGTSITWTRPALSGISNAAIITPQSSNPNETLVNTTASPIDVVYVYSLTSNGCTNTQNVVVRVNPAPTLSSTLTPAAVCSNSAFTYAPTSLTAGASFAWTRSVVAGISNGVGSGSGNINETIINTTANPIAVLYAYTITANGCSSTQNVTVTVNPTPNITGSPIDITICSGETFNFTPQNGVNGRVPAGTTYTWTRVDNTNISGDSNQSTPQSSISQTLTTTSNLTSIHTVNYTVTPRTGTCPVGSTFQVRVTVNPTPTVNAVSNQTLCEGANTAALTFGGNTIAGKTYTWTNSNPSIGLAASGTGNGIPSFTARNSGSAPATATITVTPVANGCAGTQTTFTITVNPAPIVTIVPDYCVVGGRVQLVANSNVPGTTWLWNTGQTTSSILVDLSGNYTVVATAGGCSTTATISVAQELVVDGSFTNFNPASPSFFTEYTQNQNFYVNGNPATGLWPEGYYAVNVNANGSTTTTPQGYHTSFYGRDRTNNPNPADRKFLMVNGATTTIGTPPRQRIIWQQTVTVEPNTDYYFSAWAMNLNPSNPAVLQFEVNGVLVGTIADLNDAPKPTTNGDVNLNNWVRFYSNPTWNSGTATTAVIRIRNLNTTAGGNDFGLDDISFGTLKPFIVLTSEVGSDDQVICQDSPLRPLSYNAGSGIFGPEVTGLPNGITAIWNGIDLQFIGSPTESGTFNYTITTVGTCVPATATGTITVRSTPTAGVIAADQTVCAGQTPVALSSTQNGTGQSGSSLSYRWESNTNLSSPNWTVVSGQTGATYDPPALSATTQYRRITLATLGSVATNNLTVCESPPTAPVTVTVQNVPTPGSIAADQVVCMGGDPAPFTSTAAGNGDGTITYRWESAVGDFASWAIVAGAVGANYDAPIGLSETTRFRRVTISTLNGVACESAPASPVQVTVNPEPTAGTITSDQEICSGENPAPITSTADGTGAGTVYYIWESAVSPFTGWTEISGANLPTYDPPAGLTVNTQYRRTTVALSNGITCESIPTTPVQVTILPEIEVFPVDPNPPLCLGVHQVTIIHSSTGATGITNEGVAGANGLPLGISAGFNTTNGNITISGTPTEVGTFNYSIPVVGNCGTDVASGTITVNNPTYPITSIVVDNPPVDSGPDYISTFTVFSPELLPGDYKINYSTSGANQVADQIITVTVTSTNPGQFTFESLPYSNEGTTILTINSIEEISDPSCPYNPPNNNTTPFGVNCSTEFMRTGGDASFSVPADVTELIIQAFGDGLSGGTPPETMAVIPGGTLFVVFNGDDVFVTEAPPSVPMGDRIAQAIASANGPNGRVVINYDCTPPPPCSGTGNVTQYTDSEGYTIIRVTGDCSSWTWTAPDGLDEFEVLVVGGGGGGGYGEAAGGGGGGEVIYHEFTGVRMNGLPGLQGATFEITPGGIGLGASGVNMQGEDGAGSSFTGSSFTYDGSNTFSGLNAAGGGGGGSSSSDQNIRTGRDGASGGGGAAFGTVSSDGGYASIGAGNDGGNGYGQSFGSFGAGGGGYISGGENGNGDANRLSAGSGGNGTMQGISGEDIYYGAGGGGTSSGATVNEPGMGGSQYTVGGSSYYAGGRGNNTGVGLPATTFGSGGGAGRTGGSNGFQGVVYIRYPSFRILPVEYLYFNATYESAQRSGKLTWATAKEWENERFEIERAVNNFREWETIGDIPGAGNSDGPVEYEFTDSNLPAGGGNIFYRIKEFNLDGNFTYSVTRSIKVESLAGYSYWIVYPNPTTGNPINLKMLDAGAYIEEWITVRVISATGVFEVIEGKSTSQLSVELSNILEKKSAGIYTLEINWATFKEYHKIILRR